VRRIYETSRCTEPYALERQRVGGAIFSRTAFPRRAVQRAAYIEETRGRCKRAQALAQQDRVEEALDANRRAENLRDQTCPDDILTAEP
jgi:hypothetical protein